MPASTSGAYGPNGCHAGTFSVSHRWAWGLRLSTEGSDAALEAVGPPTETADEPAMPPLRNVEGSREAVQETGREGVLEAKRWLESTTRVQLPFNAYEMTSQCSLPLLGDAVKCYDLRGYFFDDGRPLLVEVKKYSSAGDQGPLFKRFLAEAYSTTAKHWQQVGDPKFEFMWVTWHPFSQTDWSTILTPGYMTTALAANDDVLDKQAVNRTVLDAVSQRTWVLVLHDKQRELRPADNEIAKILTHLGRLG